MLGEETPTLEVMGDAKEKRQELWGVMVRMMGRNRDSGVAGGDTQRVGEVEKPW